MPNDVAVSRLARRNKFKKLGATAAAAATAALAGTTPSQAELIEYTAEIELTDVGWGVNNTTEDDTMTFRATVETDSVDVWTTNGVNYTQVLVEDFEYLVTGSSTEVWRGTGGALTYIDDPTGDNSLYLEVHAIDRFGGRAVYEEFGEFVPNQIGWLRAVGDDSIFTSFHPSGIPLTLDPLLWGNTGLQLDLSWESSVGIRGFATSLNGTPFYESPPTCALGDADCDGYVSNLEDIQAAFTNFTGPGTTNWTTPKTRFQGDVHDEVLEGTTDLTNDFDVDNLDIQTMFTNFNPAPDEAGDVTGATSDLDPAIPDLVYDPVTGEVVIDWDGNTLISYVLKNATNSFIPVAHSNILLGSFPTKTSNELSESTSFAEPGVTTKSMGNVFPTGLDLSGLQSMLTVNSIVQNLGGPQVPFDLVVLGPAVPEPSTAILAATAGLAGLSALRKRRRGELERQSA